MIDFKQRIKGWKLGFHVLVDIFFNKYPKDLKDLTSMKKLLESVISQAQLIAVKKDFHEFKPQGLTGYYILAESHLAFHTWPEKNYLAVDLFTCSKSSKAKLAIRAIKGKLKEYKPKRIKIKIVRRGYIFDKDE